MRRSHVVCKRGFVLHEALIATRQSWDDRADSGMNSKRATIVSKAWKAPSWLKSFSNNSESKRFGTKTRNSGKRKAPSVACKASIKSGRLSNSEMRSQISALNLLRTSWSKSLVNPRSHNQSKSDWERQSLDEKEVGEMLSLSVSDDSADEDETRRGRLRWGSINALLAIKGGGNEKGIEGCITLPWVNGYKGGFIGMSITLCANGRVVNMDRWGDKKVGQQNWVVNLPGV